MDNQNIQSAETKEIDPVRNCKRCNGTKVASYDANRTCIWCKGTGIFNRPDFVTIIDSLKGRGGKLRSTKPKNDLRAAYVWRMARFHGGKDITLPMMATLDIEGDPYEPELNKVSEMIARRCFGNDTAGAMTWGKAFGIIQ